MPTATSARNSRSRSSNRCEIRVPSASFSGSSLIGAARLRVVRVGDIGRQLVPSAVRGRVQRSGGTRAFPGRLGGGGHRLNRRRRGGALCLARLFELHFLLELLAKLTRHGAGSSDPTAHFRHYTRQLLPSPHDQRQDEDDQYLREPALEQITCSVRSWCRSSSRPPGIPRPDPRSGSASVGCSAPPRTRSSPS